MLGALQSIFLMVQDFLKFSEPPHTAWLKFRKWLVVTVLGAVALLLVPQLSGHSFNPWFSAVTFTVMTVPYLMSVYLWIKMNTLSLFDVGCAIFLVLSTVFDWGKAIAYQQVFSTTLYKIITRDSVIEGAALVRSSSAGFIVALDGKIMFLPAAEIRQIVAETKITP